MTRRRLFVYASLLLLLITSFLLLSSAMRHEKEQPTRNVSLIIRGKNSESWSELRQGAELACSERNIELSYIALSEEGNADEQASLIRREMDGRMDAIIISAADSRQISDVIAETGGAIPIICVESAVEHKYVLSAVAPDNYRMGQDLAREAIRRNAGLGNAVVIANGAGGSILDRKKGFMSVMEDNQIECTLLVNSEPDFQNRLEALVHSQKPGAIIALDTIALEKTGLVLAEADGVHPRLYGIGCTNQIIYLIEKNVIDAIVTYNNFGLGYLSGIAAADAVDGKRPEKVTAVAYEIIDKENMYESEKQRMLFSVG